ncbi:lipoate--protein ligase family protein [Paenibacillus chartarius]|uniref:Lipoate--protein ligase family protein n=1 Tax=Paenibacillus chartarius TaxID=747481 RepID=A0ABV6DIS0_9BACL
MIGTETLQRAGSGLPERLLLLDRTEAIGFEPILYAFARDELLCRHTGLTGEAVLHLWRHPRAFVMGLRDGRLPGAAAASGWLRDLGYAAAVRNSGGAAVPLDLGVLNVSLVLPKAEGKLGFREDFQTMVKLLQGSFAELTGAVVAGEIAGSYCPGEFDLAIGGRKFCGIAQRRHANAMVVQAFIVVEGIGMERAALARAFYEKAAANAAADYPHVRPETMGSLSELTGAAVTSMQAAEHILRFAGLTSELKAFDAPDVLAEERVRRKAEELEQRYAPPPVQD